MNIRNRTSVALRVPRAIVPGLVGLLLLTTALGAQTDKAVRLDLGMGMTGTATEMFRTPFDRPFQRDPFWIYEWDAQGSRLPDFPAGRQPSQANPQENPPPADPNWTAVWSSLPNQGKRDQTDIQVSLPLVLFPIEVKANLAWQPTGIQLQRGQRYAVEAIGQWSMHKAERWCGPNGRTQDGPLGNVAAILPNHPSPLCPVPGEPAGTLVGRIGGGTPFKIGEGGDFQADRDGELELMANDVFDTAPAGQSCPICGDPDGHMWNNEGQLRVGVSVPEEG